MSDWPTVAPAGSSTVLVDGATLSGTAIPADDGTADTPATVGATWTGHFSYITIEGTGVFGNPAIDQIILYLLFRRPGATDWQGLASLSLTTAAPYAVGSAPAMAGTWQYRLAASGLVLGAGHIGASGDVVTATAEGRL